MLRDFTCESGRHIALRRKVITTVQENGAGQVRKRPCNAPISWAMCPCFVTSRGSSARRAPYLAFQVIHRPSHGLGAALEQ